MTRILFWIAIGIVTLLAGCFAISNRMDVTLTFWPFPGALDAPLYLLVLLLLSLGFLLGRGSAWLAYGGIRVAHRRRAKELDRLRGERAQVVRASESRSLVT